MMTDKQLIERLLEMQEHPEQTTDERLRVGDGTSGMQVRQMLGDEQMHELVEQMAFTKRAFKNEETQTEELSIADEWEKFAASHADGLDALDKDKAQPHSSLFTFRSALPLRSSKNSSLHKIAAAFIGVVLASGIALAAIHIVRSVGEDLKTPTQEVRSSNSPQRQDETQPADSTAQSRLYDNVHLGEILDELSTYYNIKVVYYTEDARHPRLYYQWKPEYTIEKVVEMLNNFEWLQMELKNDTLYVKSTAIPAHDC